MVLKGGDDMDTKTRKVVVDDRTWLQPICPGCGWEAPALFRWNTHLVRYMEAVPHDCDKYLAAQA